MNYIIGAGGVGSWLAPALIMLTRKDSVTVVDGDKLEQKNLNRQLFTAQEIGRFKADALAKKYGCHSRPQWFSYGMTEMSQRDVLLCAVDNHPARLESLRTADLSGCLVIIGANETTSAEAYVYRREWQGTALDPRMFYPEINTETTGDPRAAAIGCTGEAQEQNPQLVTANFMAAALMQHLFVLWALKIREFNEEAREYLPHHLVSNLTRMSSRRICDSNQQPTEERIAHATTTTTA